MRLFYIVPVKSNDKQSTPTFDIFCSVIDNFGDAGVCWRFCRELHLALPDSQIRLFCNDFVTLNRIENQLDISLSEQVLDAITIIHINSLTPQRCASIIPADVVIEAFGCELPEAIMPYVNQHTSLVINLEYLTAEAWAVGYHKTPSPLPTLKPEKYFYMPGFLPGTGGVLIDSGMLKRSASVRASRNEILRSLVIAPFRDQMPLTTSGSPVLVGTIFTYETDFSGLCSALRETTQPFLIMLCGEKTHHSFLETVFGLPIDVSAFTLGASMVVMVPWLSQTAYEDLLLCADFNIVRGEDSLLRAIQCGVPFLWQAYPQENDRHLEKSDALCNIFGQWLSNQSVRESYIKHVSALNTTNVQTGLRGSAVDYLAFLNSLPNLAEGSAGFCEYCISESDLVKKFISFIFQKFYKEN